MTKFRIRKSPSGEHFRVEYLTETLKSRLLRLLLPELTPKMVWRYVKKNGIIMNYCTEGFARTHIEMCQKDALDSIAGDWSIIQV